MSFSYLSVVVSASKGTIAASYTPTHTLFFAGNNGLHDGDTWVQFLIFPWSVSEITPTAKVKLK